MNVGDWVVGETPFGRVVGRVTKIDADPADTFITVAIAGRELDSRYTNLPGNGVFGPTMLQPVASDQAAGLIAQWAEKTP